MVPMHGPSAKGATHEPACSAGFPDCGFTGLSSPVDQERATGKSPEPAGSKACATNPPRFMVPMRAIYDVEALHEPEDTWLDSEDLTYFRFLVPMRDKKGVQATHEPERRAPAVLERGV